jgi:transposase, IS30 family
MSHKQCTDKDIYAIEIYLKEWYNYSQIGRKIEKHPSSIKRLVDNYKSKKTGIFHAHTCIKEKQKIRTQVNRENRKRITPWSPLEKFILKSIKKYLSPDEVAWRWKREIKESLSPDTIYKYIYKYHPVLIKKYLRRWWKKYQNRRKEKYQLEDRMMIDNRPEIVETRSRIWDWEWDTVVWPRWWSKQVLLTNVERKTWYLLCKKLHNGTWRAVLEGTLKCFKNIPKYKQCTMTYDNGREFSEHRMIGYLTNLEIYFAHPYSSHERGTNENTNWLLRQFFPKKTDFASVSENQLKYYVSLVNFRPRKRLNYKTPHEVFFNKSLKLCNSC